MDISLELKGLPCLNKVYLLTYLLTPWLIGVTPKHVVTNSDDGNCRTLVITERVEGGCREAVSFAMPTSVPLTGAWAANNRF